ncbi:MAG: PfkB family carbohydrate kinase, partial [Armatimonadota bacterium]
ATMPPHICILGNINVDFVMRSPRIPRLGETLVVEGLRIIPGGKAANQAVAAARLGARVTLIGCVGGNDAYGRGLVENFEREGIDVRFVNLDPDAHTGAAFVGLLPSGDNFIMTALGANLSCTRTQVEAAAEAIQRADVFMTQFSVPFESISLAVQLAKDAGVPVLVDPTPIRGAVPEGWRRADVITPNETEAQALLGTDCELSPEEAGRRLLDAGVGAAVMKLGERGCVVVDAAGARPIPGVRVEVVDTTAAGDAFAAALAVRLAEGADVDDAAAYANHVGALTVTRMGAQPSLPRRDDVQRLIGRRGD